MTLEELRKEWETEPYAKGTGQSFEQFLALEILVRDKMIERLYGTIRNWDEQKQKEFLMVHNPRAC